MGDEFAAAGEVGGEGKVACGWEVVERERSQCGH